MDIQEKENSLEAQKVAIRAMGATVIYKDLIIDEKARKTGFDNLMF